jgi:hypothetical protein
MKCFAQMAGQLSRSQRHGVAGNQKLGDALRSCASTSRIGRATPFNSTLASNVFEVL